MAQLFEKTVWLCALLTCVRGQKDQTIVSQSKGAGVVEATCNRIASSCIFPDDKLFTRRLAYVESHDGNDQDTFRTGYYGGIWQVDKSMFDVTQTTSARSFLSQYITNIQGGFGIYWPSVRWEDLTKPLYSALAMRLYLQYQSRTSNNGIIPRPISGQATYWATYYRPGSPSGDYTTEVQKLDQGCTANNGADLVFVMDASGSIGDSNFAKIKTFMEDVVSYFDIGHGVRQYRVGVVKYSDGVNREFNLNTYMYDQKTDVINAVRRIKYTGGGTNTHLGIDEMAQRSFTEANGARPLKNGHPRVGIVVTDGKSNDPGKTILSAVRAHDADISMFAIGIGNSLNLEELDMIASHPKCVLRIVLSDFTEVESLKYAIEKQTCDAPVIISPGVGFTIESRLVPRGSQNYRIKVPIDGTTIEIQSSDGQVTFYTSSSSYPSSDYYEETVGANPGRRGVISLPHSSSSNGTVYANIQGDDTMETNIIITAVRGDAVMTTTNRSVLTLSLLAMYFTVTYLTKS